MNAIENIQTCQCESDPDIRATDIFLDFRERMKLQSLRRENNQAHYQYNNRNDEKQRFSKCQPSLTLYLTEISQQREIEAETQHQSSLIQKVGKWRSNLSFPTDIDNQHQLPRQFRKKDKCSIESRTCEISERPADKKSTRHYCKQ